MGKKTNTKALENIRDEITRLHNRFDSSLVTKRILWTFRSMSILSSAIIMAMSVIITKQYTSDLLLLVAVPIVSLVPMFICICFVDKYIQSVNWYKYQTEQLDDMIKAAKLVENSIMMADNNKREMLNLSKSFFGYIIAEIDGLCSIMTNENVDNDTKKMIYDELLFRIMAFREEIRKHKKMIEEDIDLYISFANRMDVIKGL